MKLRFRKNSLRLRVNRQEAESLSEGSALQEQIHFPGNSTLSYVLQPLSDAQPTASFQDGVIRIGAPREQFRAWAADDDSIGIYFDLPGHPSPSASVLRVAIEKDLECLDGPEEERDPDAFPRVESAAC